MKSRREFLVSAAHTLAGATAVLAASPARLRAIQSAGPSVTGAAPADVARDESLWTTVAQAFHVDGRYIILNGGGQNPPTTAVTMPIPNSQRYQRVGCGQTKPTGSGKP